MVQPIDLNSMRPIYNAVNIKIKKPEVNAGGREDMSFVTDNGIYNAVNIKIDNPAVNTESKKNTYDYPVADGIVTYDMTGIAPVKIPAIEYKETATIVIPDKKDDSAKSDNTTPVVPEPNYTTLEAEKADSEKKTLNAVNEEKESVSFHGTDDIKKPEIIPSEEIKPDVNIAEVVANLSSEDFDKQAKQMEEIARLSIDNPKNAIPYIVKDVFNNLIEISKKDSSKLPAPTEQQVVARQKLIADFLAIERNPQSKQVPYKLSEEEIALASAITPMEQAERNKEYAIYTIAVLAKVYVDEINKETGNIVPMTDVPGMSAIVDALRNSQNPGVKVAAIDALLYQRRPEYKEELMTLYSIAQADKNPQVSQTASRAIAKVNKN